MLGEMMRKKGYKNNFSTIKIIAACMVVIAHSYPLSGVTGEPLAVVTKGRLGLGDLAVQLFFSISGFLITCSVFRMFQKKSYKSLKKCVIGFFKRRFLRLFPSLLIVNFIVFFIVVPIFSTGNRLGYFLRADPYVNFMKTSFLFIVYRVPHLWVNNPLATEVNGSLWTLPIEFICYIALFLGIIFGFIGKICYHNHYLEDSYKGVRSRNSRSFLRPVKDLTNGKIFGTERYILLKLCQDMFVSRLKIAYRKTACQSSKQFAIRQIVNRFLEKFGMLFMFSLFLFQPCLLSSGTISFLHSWILELCLIYYFSSLYYVYREKIVLNWKLFIIIFVICVVLYCFNFGVYTIVFLPYLVFYLAYAVPQFSFLNRLGKYSYECYLVAFPIQQGLVFLEGGGHPWKITFLTLPLMFLAAVGISQIKDRLLLCKCLKGLLTYD
jgi:peptidoglycan/LPS O-acetylase OafA/YrhL